MRGVIGEIRPCEHAENLSAKRGNAVDVRGMVVARRVAKLATFCLTSAGAELPRDGAERRRSCKSGNRATALHKRLRPYEDRGLGFDRGQSHVLDILAAGDGKEIAESRFGLGFAAWIEQSETQ